MDNNPDFITIGQTTYEVQSFYEGDTSLLGLLKHALQRDAQAVLRQHNNPLADNETT